MNKVYINSIGKFLPGEAISNDLMEEYIGKINGQKSRLGPLALRQNKIKQRHYAIDKNQETKWTVASLVNESIKEALLRSELSASEIKFLSAATTQADMLVPGFVSMLHGISDLPPLEVASFQSVCGSCMMATKSAYLQIKAEEHPNAIVGAGEFASRFFQPGFYENTTALDENNSLPLSAEFLRWTLSDGAGALVLENRPNQNGLSLEIEWIHLKSFANRFQPCMYAGSKYDETQPWPNYYNPGEAFKNGAMFLQQNFRTLHEMLPVWVGEYAKLVDEGKINIDSLDWFLCHYSTHSLRIELVKLLEKAGCMVSEEKWFTNLYNKGNTGSASIFIMLEELFYEKDIKKGQNILCIVPESGRSIISFMMLKVV